MAGNRWRNGWPGFLNGRVRQVGPVAGGRNIEVPADVFNMLNLINSLWGRYRDITTSPSVTLLTLVGWDTANERGMYRLSSNSVPARGVVDDVASRWRVQLGARYAF